MIATESRKDMCDYYSEGREIRFIDSNYNTLFHIPDGEYIQISSAKKTWSECCVFLDRYHTRIGWETFHICEFAETMERSGLRYQPEPPILGDEGAWRVGFRKYLLIQKRNAGYVYAFLREDFHLLESGIYGGEKLGKVRNEILSDHSLSSPLHRVSFWEVLKKTEGLETLFA